MLGSPSRCDTAPAHQNLAVFAKAVAGVEWCSHGDSGGRAKIDSAGRGLTGRRGGPKGAVSGRRFGLLFLDTEKSQIVLFIDKHLNFKLSWR